MITGKLNLLALKGVVKKMNGKTGLMDCLVIPIELNHLFYGQKGIYLDLVAFDLKSKPEGSKETHLIKQSFNKEQREKFTQDELDQMPILGGLSVWGGETRITANLDDIPEPIEGDDNMPF